MNLNMLTVTLLWLALTTGPAAAMTMTFGGAADDSLHGASGALTITQSGAGSFDVTWSIDFDGFDVRGAERSGHTLLSDIGFKAFSSISVVSLDSIDWSQSTTGTLIPSGRLSNAGCTGPSRAAFVCVTDLAPDVDATMGGLFEAHFSVEGELAMDEWSYRGKFGPENGWVISESSSPIPEPQAALVYGLGLAVAARRFAR